MSSSIHFDDLRFFLAVARSGTVAGGARELGTDPSTASRRLTRLEEELGVSLFARVGKRLEPTEAGVRLASRTQHAMNILDVAIDEVTRGTERLSGPIRMAAPSLIGTVYVVPRLRPFLDRHPDIDLRLLLGTRVLELDRREADIALRTVRPTRGDVVIQSLGARPVIAMRSPDLDDATARRRWLTFVQTDPIAARALAADPSARVVLRSNDLAGLRAAAVQGLGAALMPREAGEEVGLVPVAGVPAVPGAPVWLAAPKTSLELPRVRALWDFVVGEFRDLAAG